MGTRYVMDVTCPECGHIATDCYYAPTCDFVTHVCESCGAVIDLGEYTGINYEDVSNAEEIKTVMAKLGAGMAALGQAQRARPSHSRNWPQRLPPGGRWRCVQGESTKKLPAS